MSFKRKFKVRTPLSYYSGAHLELELDNEAKLSDILSHVRHQRKGAGSGDVDSMPKIWLLPRWNEKRNDGSALPNRPVPLDRDLSTVPVQDGDTFDMVANPEVFVCLCAMSAEFAFAHARFGDQDAKKRCPRCGDETEYEDRFNLGNWHYCMEPSCRYPALVSSAVWNCKLDALKIRAYELRKHLGNCKNHFSAADLDAEGEHLKRLPGSDLRTQADLDTLFEAARSWLVEQLDKRQSTAADTGRRPHKCSIEAGVLALLHVYLEELHELIASGAPDPLTAFIRNHQPENSMPFSASLRSGGGGGSAAGHAAGRGAGRGGSPAPRRTGRT